MTAHVWCSGTTMAFASSQSLGRFRIEEMDPSTGQEHRIEADGGSLSKGIFLPPL
jgi:hypothetical protein